MTLLAVNRPMASFCPLSDDVILEYLLKYCANRAELMNLVAQSCVFYSQEVHYDQRNAECRHDEEEKCDSGSFQALLESVTFLCKMV